MPRTARQILRGIPHHIVLRGNNRRRLFSYPRDYLFFLGLMSAQLIRSDVGMHALCLMPNHVHLLATPFKEDAFGEIREARRATIRSGSQQAVRHHREALRAALLLEAHAVGGAPGRRDCVHRPESRQSVSRRRRQRIRMVHSPDSLGAAVPHSGYGQALVSNRLVSSSGRGT